MQLEEPLVTLLHLPHHDGSALYVSKLAPKLGESVIVRLRVPHRSSSSSVWVRTVRDGEPTFVVASIESCDETETWWTATVELHNSVTSYRWRLVEPDRWVTQEGLIIHDPTDICDFRIVTHSAPPDWSLDAIFYQVFPDRFARSSDAESWQKFPSWSHPSAWNDPVEPEIPLALTQLYGGDLAGITEHLDYLGELGVNAVYSTPFFPAESNHRYDSTSFDNVDTLLGGDEALSSLVDNLHGAEIRFIGDVTTNHCGVMHDWFRAAQGDETGIEAGFFSFVKHPHDFETWLGVETLPKLDHSSSALQDRFFHNADSVVQRYLRPPFSMDGWRVDVANMTGRLRETDLNHEVGRQLRSAMASVNDNALLIAEHCHDATADLVGDSWYSTMNYAGFTNPICGWLGTWFPPGPHATDPQVLRPLNGQAAAETITKFAGAISWRSRCANMTLLGSHDSVRFRSLVGGDRRLHHVGAALLMTFPGMPSIFQGDELGMSGKHSHLARAPMPWNDRGQWDAETLEVYQSLIATRKHSIALRRGGFRWVSIGDDHLSFLRESPDEVVLVFASRTSAAVPEHLAADVVALLSPPNGMVTNLVTKQTMPLEDALAGGNGPRAVVVGWQSTRTIPAEKA